MEKKIAQHLNTILKNFVLFQKSLEEFMENKNVLLSMCKEKILSDKTYEEHVVRLFDMLAMSADSMKNIMLKTQKRRDILLRDGSAGNSSKTNGTDIFDTASVLPELTRVAITGYQDGQSYVGIDTELNVCIADKSSDLNIEEYGNIRTSHFKRGFIISEAAVSSIPSDGLYFYITLIEGRYRHILTELFEANNRRMYKNPPTPGTIFGINLDNGFMRAIHCLPVSSRSIYLLDYGEIIYMPENMGNLFYLTKEEQNIPPQAVFCKLYFPIGTAESEIQRGRDHLKSLLFLTSGFRIIKNVGGILYLEILIEKEPSTQGVMSPPLRKNASKEINQTTKRTQLTPKNLETIYEESACTSNALRAAMGHAPKDDEKICRFYDPKTGGCFKGNNCRKLHVPLREDYITKDLVLANAYSESLREMAFYEAGQVLKILVTHVTNLVYFYGIIGTDEPFIFENEEIPSSDYLQKLPFKFDIVLAKYEGKWYRAEVVDIDEKGKAIEVFYIDYGNRQTVKLSTLAKCSEHIGKLPPQAQQFRLADISIIPNEEETQLKGMAILSDMILEKELNVVVVDHYEDLVVRFQDEPYSDIPQLLASKRCVKLNLS